MSDKATEQQIADLQAKVAGLMNAQDATMDVLRTLTEGLDRLSVVISKMDKEIKALAKAKGASDDAAS